MQAANELPGLLTGENRGMESDEGTPGLTSDDQMQHLSAF